MIKDVVITNLNIIKSPGGNVKHAMKSTDNGFKGFGEAYFSHIDKAVAAFEKVGKKLGVI